VIGLPDGIRVRAELAPSIPAQARGGEALPRQEVRSVALG
jgi:hypothetical protein